jgi:hypothetical protein
MNDRDRLEHLRGLLDRLERMPVSADRDWMLNEVRARAVDVETGVTPARVLALPVVDEQAASAAAEAAPVRASGTPARPRSIRVKTPRRAAGTTVRTTPAVSPSRSPLPPLRERNAVDLLQPGGRLCLGDPPAPIGALRPWTGGLRG